MSRSGIPFNRPHVAGKELYHIAQCVLGGHTSGDGPYGKKCQEFISKLLETPHALMTTSASAGLDIATLACNIGAGDEVIMPSFTSAGVANAVLDRGATIRFCDIREDTLTLDVLQAAALVNDQTKAIIVRHYGGVAADMDEFMALASANGLWVIEDASEAFNSRYRGRALGTIGHVGVYSFHETKDFTCGEGGALVTSEREVFEKAEIIREKGTNRSQFFRGQVDKYTWMEIGSSYVPSDLLSAFLYGQLEELAQVTERRRQLYLRYSKGLASLADTGVIQIPNIPVESQTNYHRFHIIVESESVRTELIEFLRTNNITAVFHFRPLHSSTFAKRNGLGVVDLPTTDSHAARILRLPFYSELTIEELDFICDKLMEFYSS